MTVQEANRDALGRCKMRGCNLCDGYRKELEQYRALGTVEELKEAREKQVAKKPIIWENKSIDSPIPNDDWGYECPCCGNRDIDYPEHHCECGQALKWSEEDD